MLGMAGREPLWDATVGSASAPDCFCKAIGRGICADEELRLLCENEPETGEEDD